MLAQNSSVGGAQAFGETSDADRALGDRSRTEPAEPWSACAFTAGELAVIGFVDKGTLWTRTVCHEAGRPESGTKFLG